MRYYTKELTENERLRNTAGVKARDDVDAILETAGFCPLPIYYVETLDRKRKLQKQFSIGASLRKGCASLTGGDLLFVQFPLRRISPFFTLLVQRLRRRGVRIVVLLHDLEILRLGKTHDAALTRRLSIRMTELGVFKLASRIIVHNSFMKERVVSLGIEEDRVVPLEIFDYLIPDFDAARRAGKTGKDKPVIIAGNLRPNKSVYAYHLPENCDFNLYGIDYSGELHGGSRYYGAFPPEEVPYVMEGSFGLVWDGESTETCSGTFGEYLRINNPHKTSLYLAAGIPVAIWKEAALADFIVKNKAGIAVGSLHELRSAIDSLSEAEYAEMVKNAEAIGEKLRSGAYTLEALRKCE